jgi:hypothetical protein
MVARFRVGRPLCLIGLLDGELVGRSLYLTRLLGRELVGRSAS